MITYYDPLNGVPKGEFYIEQLISISGFGREEFKIICHSSNKQELIDLATTNKWDFTSQWDYTIKENI